MLTGMRYRDDHVFFHDHVFDVDVFGAGDDFRAALVAVFCLDFIEFVDDDLQDFLRIIQNPLQISDEFGDFGVFFVNLRSFQTGQALPAAFPEWPWPEFPTT